MSGDGNIVVFKHYNTEYAGLPKVDGGHGHVYWKNLSTGELRVVDIKEDGTPSDAKAGSGGYGISLSKDGMQVAFIQDPLSSLEEGPIPGHTETVFYTDLGSDVQYVSQYSSIYVRDMSLENGTSISLLNSSKDQVP